MADFEQILTPSGRLCKGGVMNMAASGSRGVARGGPGVARGGPGWPKEAQVARTRSNTHIILMVVGTQRYFGHIERIWPYLSYLGYLG